MPDKKYPTYEKPPFWGADSASGKLDDFYVKCSACGRYTDKFSTDWKSIWCPNCKEIKKHQNQRKNKI